MYMPAKSIFIPQESNNVSLIVDKKHVTCQDNMQVYVQSSVMVQPIKPWP